MKKLMLCILLGMCLFGNVKISQATEKTAAPAPTYQPILGVTIKKENVFAKQEKQVLKKKTKKIHHQIIQKQKEYNKILLLRSQIPTNTIFLDNHKSNHYFDSVKNTSLYKYSSYEAVSSIEALMYIAYIPTNDVETHNSLIMEHPVCTALNAIDVTNHINEYLSNLSKHIHSLKSKKNQLKSQIKKIDTKPITFNSNDLTVPSHLSVEGMKYLLKGTNLEQYADTYIQIEKDYHINAFVVCCISALESYWGTSRRAIEDHNYTGFGVYTDASSGINASSGANNLRMTGKHLAENYLNPNGMYYEGTSFYALNLHYAASKNWGYHNEQIGIRLMQKLQ